MIPSSVLLGLSAAFSGGSRAQDEHLSQLRGVFAERFDEAAALEDTRVIFESGWRDRGNDAYGSSVAQLRDRLIAAGFAEDGLDDVREVTLGREIATWNGRSATLSLLHEDGSEERLVGFGAASDPDRVALCRFSCATSEGGETFRVIVDPSRGDDVKGAVVLASGGARSLSARYVTRGGARGVLSASIAEYNRPDEDDGVIQFGSIVADVARRSFGFQLSPAAHRSLRKAASEGPVQVRVVIDAGFGAPVGAQLLIATVAGTRPELAPLWVTAHLDEPGANDNASGCATAVHAALALRRAIVDGALPRPARSLVFLIGQEIEGPRLLLAAREGVAGAGGPPLAGVSLDMTGEDPVVNGAPFLIERLPDPSAVRLRPPDRHTEWGSGRTAVEDMVPHALDAISAAALAAVAFGVPEFQASTNPYEGGSDHQPLLDRGIPAVLFWHFTDRTYHTNRDTMEQVSAAELERTGLVTLLTVTELAMGDRMAEERARAYVLSQARERFGFEATNAATHPEDEDLRWAIDAYERWFKAAIESCTGLGADARDPEEAAQRAADREAGLAEVGSLAASLRERLSG